MESGSSQGTVSESCVAMQVRLPYNFQPREYQLPGLAAHDRGCKRIFDVWHRRSGKDVTWWNQTIKKSFQRVGTYYYVLPTYRQARKIIWDGISDTGFRYLDYCPKLVRMGKPNETEMKIRMCNGSVVQLIGSDSYDSMVGTNPVGIVYSEYALQDPMAWELMRPILAENQGWAAFLTTPRGHNHAWDLSEVAKTSPDWFYSLLTIDDTLRDDGVPVITKTQYEREIAEGMDPDLAKQEFYCSFEGPNQGSYYGQWLENAKHDGRILRLPHDPRLPVHTFWDLGVDDSTAIWFMQNIRSTEFRFIHYHEATGRGLDYFVKYLGERPYTYGMHYFPHDVNVREIGNQAKARLTALNELGIRNTNTGLALDVMDGIQQVRGVLPLCWFDEEGTKIGLKHLFEYRRAWDDKKKIWRDYPQHDKTSHAADAFREFANSFQDVPKPRERKIEGRVERGGWIR
jgi:phage terminase large subunit